MVVFILLTLLFLAVAVFALQNPDPIRLRFLMWEIPSSVAILALGATTVGAVIAGLIGLASRLRRWRRGRVSSLPAPTPGDPVPPRPEPEPPARPTA